MYYNHQLLYEAPDKPSTRYPTPNTPTFKPHKTSSHNNKQTVLSAESQQPLLRYLNQTKGGN